MIFGRPFGAIMADSGPSRPRQPPRDGFAAPEFFRESSGARLGAVFRPFSREVRRILRFFDFRVKKLRFQDLDFLIGSFLIGMRPVHPAWGIRNASFRPRVWKFDGQFGTISDHV